MGGEEEGGGRGLTPREQRLLEEMAKKLLKAATGPRKHNIFISFAAEDLNDVIMLRGQAKNENSEIEFNDWSLKKPFDSKSANYIKRGIRERIRQSSVTVVYISEKTADSKWVDWEIRESIVLGKGVVAMYKGDRPPHRLPKALTEYSVPVVPWNQKELANTIKKEAGEE